MSDYEKVINDCNSALKSCSKAVLLPRCKALEALERFEEAYQDAEIIALNPNDEDFQRLVDHLREIVQERRKEKSHISAQVSEMLDLAFDGNASEPLREIAMNNLFMLAFLEVT